MSKNEIAATPDWELNELLAKAGAAYDAMTPEQKAELHEAQKKSWVRAFTIPCEHGWLDFEDCPECRMKARLSPPKALSHD